MERRAPYLDETQEAAPAAKSETNELFGSFASGEEETIWNIIAPTEHLSSLLEEQVSEVTEALRELHFLPEYESQQPPPRTSTAPETVNETKPETKEEEEEFDIDRFLNEVHSELSSEVGSAEEEMEPEQIAAQEEAIVSRLTELLQDSTLTTQEKAKEFARFVGRYIDVRKVRTHAWEAALEFLHTHRNGLLLFLTTGAAATTLFKVLLPVLGIGSPASFGILKFALETGYPQAFFGFMASALWSLATKALLRGSLELLKRSPLLRPFLTRNLLGFLFAQRTLGWLPERYQELTMEQLVQWIMVNGSLAYSTKTWDEFVMGKGVQYAMSMTPTARAVAGTVRTAASASRARIQAAKQGVEQVFAFLENVPARAEHMIQTSVRANTTPTATERWAQQQHPDASFEQLLQQSPDGGAEAVLEDINNEEVQSLLGHVVEDTVQELSREMDNQVPMEAVPSTTILPRAVEAEREQNGTQQALQQGGRQAVVIGGALLALLVGARVASNNSEAVLETLRELLPADDNIFDVLSSITVGKYLSENVKPDMVLFNLISHTIGIPALLQSLAGKIPIERIEALRKLDEQLRRTNETLLDQRNTLATTFVGVLIGKRIYTRAEIEKMHRRELLDALTETDMPRESPVAALRDTLYQMQVGNIRNLHRMLVGGVATTIGTMMATRASMHIGLGLWERHRALAVAFVNDPILTAQAGLDVLERKSLEAYFSRTYDSLGLYLGAASHTAAERWAHASGAGWEALMSGFQKMEANLGLRPAGWVEEQEWLRSHPLQGRVVVNPSVTTTTREQYHADLARQRGFETWEELKSATAASAGASAAAALKTSTLPEPTHQEETLRRMHDARLARAAAQQVADTDRLCQDLIQSNPDLLTAIAANPALSDALRQTLVAGGAAQLYLTETGTALGTDLLSSLQNLHAPPMTIPEPPKPPETAQEFASRVLGPELAKELDQQILPLVYHVTDPVSMLSRFIGGPLRWYDTAADAFNAGVLAARIGGVLLRTHSATKESLLAQISSHLPLDIRLPRLADIAPGSKAYEGFLENQRIHIGQVVATAFVKYTAGSINQHQMVGEIAAVLAAGQGSGQEEVGQGAGQFAASTISAAGSGGMF